MIDFVVGGIVVAAVGLALAYIIKSRKNGVKCIGCPEGRNCCSCGHTGESASVCGSDNGSCTDCGCHTNEK